MKGTHREILSDMNNKVYNIRVNNEEEINRIQEKYKAISIQSDVDSTILRVVSDTMPKELNVESTSARFEDVYMFYFNLENAKEV